MVLGDPVAIRLAQAARLHTSRPLAHRSGVDAVMFSSGAAKARLMPANRAGCDMDSAHRAVPRHFDREAEMPHSRLMRRVRDRDRPPVWLLERFLRAHRRRVAARMRIATGRLRRLVAF